MENYIVDVELTKYRGMEVCNTRAVKVLLQVIAQMTPYEVDIAKLSRATGITFVAADNIESASLRKNPIWTFGFIY